MSIIDLNVNHRFHSHQNPWGFDGFTKRKLVSPPSYSVKQFSVSWHVVSHFKCTFDLLFIFYLLIFCTILRSCMDNLINFTFTDCYSPPLCLHLVDLESTWGLPLRFTMSRRFLVERSKNISMWMVSVLFLYTGVFMNIYELTSSVTKGSIDGGPLMDL